MLGAVRARQNELVRIEQAMQELALLFQELDTLVVYQEPVIAAVDDNAQNAVHNLEQGTQQISKATDLAKHRRKLKWWALAITVAILLIIGIALALYFTIGPGGKK